MKKRNSEDFQKKAVVWLATLLYILILVNTRAAPAWAQEKPANFYFVTVDKAGVRDRIAMSGTGVVSGSEVVGGGSFTHFMFNMSAATGSPGPPPYQIVASGTWNATRLVSFNLIGNYGVLAAGVLEMEINLYREIPSPAVFPATLRVVCNLAPAKLINIGSDGSALKEGITLSVTGTDFASGGTAGPFVPFNPPNGVTVFSTSTDFVASLQSSIKDRDTQISDLNSQISSLSAQLSQAQQLNYGLGGLAVLFLITTIIFAVRKRTQKK